MKQLDNRPQDVSTVSHLCLCLCLVVLMQMQDLTAIIQDARSSSARASRTQGHMRLLSEKAKVLMMTMMMINDDDADDGDESDDYER